MWKDYSAGYIKHNRASSVTVMAAAFISALLLSLLCSLFYNFWIYEIERLGAEEGTWQGRIVGEIDTKQLESIRNFANVKTASVNEELSDGQEAVIDICLHNRRTILTDMPKIAELAGISQEAVSYHHSLLSMYLIRDPMDPAPRLIFPFLLGTTVLACFSLILIINHSFAVSMYARIHQIGIFSSIGATPGQIRICLLQEAAMLCVIPVIAGNLLGILISVWIIGQTNVLAGDTAGRQEAVWQYHPWVLVFTFLITILTVWISAWMPAKKMSRLTPLEAIRNTGELQLKKKKKIRILPLLFGVEGELAGNALKAQRKALRTTTLSLVLSFLAFTLMQCFFTLTGVSQRMTYFEGYQNVWDIMVTVQDAGIDSFEKAEEIQALSGVADSAVYQKAAAKRIVTEDEISSEMAALGGFMHAPENYVTKTEEGWLVNAPLVILDDSSFLEYCGMIGAAPRLDGAVVRNQIDDVTDPDFRNRDSHDYLTGQQKTSVLRQAAREELTAEVPVLAYTREVPELREEYGSLDLYELVHFLPVSLWKQIRGQIGGEEEDFYIRILADDTTSLEALNRIKEELQEILNPEYEVLIENRIQKKIDNDHMIHGMMTVLGGFCVLLALIGIGNLFSNTLGFVRQRNREFARYMSIGMTPGGLRKLFCIEALVIAGRPVLITIPLTVLMTGYMIKISYLEPVIFIKEAPVIPVLAFLFMIAGFVALAYYLSWKKVSIVNLRDALSDDTMI